MNDLTDRINEQLAVLEAVFRALTLLGCVVDIYVQFPLEYAPLEMTDDAS